MKAPKWIWFCVEINGIERLEIRATSEEQLWRAIHILHPSPINKAEIIWKNEINYFKNPLDI